MPDDETVIRSERALTYFGKAVHFVEAYPIISEQRPIDVNLQDAKPFLLCRALKLAIKGWLVLRNGVPERMTRQEKRAIEQSGGVPPMP
jgi:hypothetical protein